MRVREGGKEKKNKNKKKVVDKGVRNVVIFILSMRIGEDNENIRRRSKDVKIDW